MLCSIYSDRFWSIAYSMINTNDINSNNLFIATTDPGRGWNRLGGSKPPADEPEWVFYGNTVYLGKVSAFYTLLYSPDNVRTQLEINYQEQKSCNKWH